MLLDAHTADEQLDPAAPLAMLLDHFDLIVQTPADVDKLDAAILQLAVEGKLVNSDGQEESANSLVQKIEDEKDRLFRAGEIRKPVKVSPVTPDEKLFSVPSNWIWCRLTQISEMINGDRGKNYPSQSELVETGIPFINAGHLRGGQIDLSRMNYITEEKYEILNSGKIRENDLIYCLRGSLGKTAIVKDVPRGAIASSLVLVRPIEAGIAPYLYLVLTSPYGQKLIAQYDNGSAQPNLASNSVAKYAIPLPPLAEQKRIVARVDELRRHTAALRAELAAAAQDAVTVNNAALNRLHTAEDADAFDAAWQTLGDAFDPLYSVPQNLTALRQTILQLAVQGKLVPQDPNDEPASKLITRIEAEKEKLIEQGALSPTSKAKVAETVDFPFSLPKGWIWCRLGEVGELARGKSKHRPRNDPMLYKDGKYPFIQTGDVSRSSGRIRSYSQMYGEKGLAQSRLWPPGTLCITIAANIAESGILDFEACFPDSIVGFRVLGNTGVVDYFQYFIQVTQSQLESFAPSTAQKNINLGILESLIVPLPPLAEQERIVAKVDELLALCDVLEAELAEAEAVRVRLVDAVLAGV